MSGQCNTDNDLTTHIMSYNKEVLNTVTDGSKSQKYCPGALFDIINTTKILNPKQHQMYKLTSNKLKMKIRL